MKEVSQFWCRDQDFVSCRMVEFKKKTIKIAILTLPDGH